MTRSPLDESFANYQLRRRSESTVNFPIIAITTLLEQSPDLIWTVDRTNALTWANPAFRAFWEGACGQELVLGAEISAALPPALLECYDQAIQGDLLQLALDWQERSFEVVVMRLLHEQRIVGLLTHARDVTLIRRELAELRSGGATLGTPAEVGDGGTAADAPATRLASTRGEAPARRRSSRRPSR